jgi:hypothetical protein
VTPLRKATTSSNEVTVYGNYAPEPNETFGLTLSRRRGYAAGRDGTRTILNGDPPLILPFEVKGEG